MNYFIVLVSGFLSFAMAEEVSRLRWEKTYSISLLRSRHFRRPPFERTVADDRKDTPQHAKERGLCTRKKGVYIIGVRTQGRIFRGPIR